MPQVEPQFQPRLTFPLSCIIVAKPFKKESHEMEVRGFLKFSALFFALCMAALPAEVEAKSKRSQIHVKVKKGYIDSHFAVSQDGKHVAYLHVLTNKKAYLVISRIKTRGVKQRSRVNIAKHTIMPETLKFVGKGRHLFLTWRANPAKPEGELAGALLDLNGAVKKKIGPFEDVRFRKEAGSISVITYRQVAGRGMVSHRVKVHSFPSLKVKAQHRLVTDQARRLKKANMEIIYFKDDYLKAVGKIAGRYDRKKDIRLPDKEAIYDLVKKKVISERPIKDAIGWEKVRRFRQKHSAFDPVFHFGGTEENLKLQLMRKDNVKVNIPMGMNLVRFRQDSLDQRFLSRGKALVALTIDPQNPIILKQKRSEPERFHLFLIKDWKAPKVKQVLKLDSDNQALQWQYGKGAFAVMRLHRRWRLGSKSLEIHKMRLP